MCHFTFLAILFKIHLAQMCHWPVLLVLFSLTENTELLSLHAHQQNPKFKGENKTVASGWMQALSCALLHQLKGDFQNLFHSKEFPDEENQQITKLCTKLDKFAILLNLHTITEIISKANCCQCHMMQLRAFQLFVLTLPPA